jgi:hypothetical protein
MARRSSRFVWLAVLGGAVVAGWRAWRSRSGAGPTGPGSPEGPSLTIVHPADDRIRPAVGSTGPAPVQATASAVAPGVVGSPGPAGGRNGSAVSSTDPHDPHPPGDAGAGEAASGMRWVAAAGGERPDGYPVKVNERSGIYHVPGGLSYERTRPTRWYTSAEAAEADGFRRAKR